MENLRTPRAKHVLHVLIEASDINENILEG